MGSGISVLHEDTYISDEELQIIYKKYKDAYAYDKWKKQLCISHNTIINRKQETNNPNNKK